MYISIHNKVVPFIVQECLRKVLRNTGGHHYEIQETMYKCVCAVSVWTCLQCNPCMIMHVRKYNVYVQSLFARICQICVFEYVCAASLATNT